MMRNSLVVAMVILLGSAPVSAADPQSAGPAKSSTPDPDKRICEKTPEIGSRLAVHTTCMTRAEWERRRLDDRQSIDRMQQSLCASKNGCGTH